MRKIAALLCILGLLLSAHVASAELDPMTTEEITLVLGTWEIYEEPDDAVLKIAVDNFMKEYPNITVEILGMSSGTLNSDLLNMAAAGTLPAPPPERCRKGGPETQRGRSAGPGSPAAAR